MTDDWDPNVIFGQVIEPCRIYGDDKGEIYALVDQEDYQWAVQWRWSPKWSRGNRKVYLRRVLHEGTRQFRTQRTLFLHSAIMKRTGILPPSPEHCIVDHRNGNGLDCRRNNLRWATHTMNARNINGKFSHELWDLK